LGRWKVIINYDGSSPRADYRNSWLRTAQRRIMVALTDGFITNSNAGKAYLTEIINARGSKVFARPYQVADVSALFNGESKNLQQKIKQKELKHPVFLFVGQIIHRKGLSYLLNSCTILRKEGIRDYSLLILGEGVQREELETFTQEQNLEDCVQWIGKVEYDRLGAYFSSSDVFILPTLEDVWGVVVLEAMACGKPIICSQFAGAAEMVVEGENGYIFDPHQPEILAEIMLRFIKNPNLALSMSQKSLELIDKHNPKEAAKFLAKVTSSVWGN
jgi:glycosyltransferase involved in cell wall biosynthesis